MTIFFYSASIVTKTTFRQAVIHGSSTGSTRNSSDGTEVGSRGFIPEKIHNMSKQD